MMEEELFLSSHGIRPTANRILILRHMEEAHTPLSMTEIETALESVDKSVVSRTLSLFRERGMLHTIEDGGDSVRYELCHSHCGEDEAHDEDLHIHFHCESCGRTFCFEDIPVPQVTLPPGFEVQCTNYVTKGLCPDCRKSHE